MAPLMAISLGEHRLLNHADRAGCLCGEAVLLANLFMLMAKTKTSAYGKQEQKIVPVRGYVKNGKRVKPHRRSTPN